MYLNHKKERKILLVTVDGKQLPEVGAFASKQQLKKNPAVLNKNKCNSKCKCLNCGNREEKKEELSCCCGESSRKKSQLEGVERKYCTNVTGKRQTIHSNVAAIRKDNLVPVFVHAIYAAMNMDKEKVTDSGDVHRKRKMTSSPPSLKRRF